MIPSTIVIQTSDTKLYEKLAEDMAKRRGIELLEKRWMITATTIGWNFDVCSCTIRLTEVIRIDGI